MLLSPHAIQRFVARHLAFLSAALLLVPGVASGDERNGQVVLVNLPLKMEDAILSAGSGDGSADSEEEKRHLNNRPAAGESSNGKLTPDNSGEDIGYMGAGLLGAAIGAGLGAAWGGTGSYGANYPQGYNPGIYGGNPYAPYPYAPVGYPLATGYRPPRPDIYYPGPGPAYGDQDYFHAVAKAAGLAGFGGSYPGYYSELLAGHASPEKVTPAGSTATTEAVGGSSGPKKPPTTGGTSGYPIDWSAVAESYYGSRTHPSPSSRSKDVPTAIFLSDSYPLLFDDY